MTTGGATLACLAAVSGIVLLAGCGDGATPPPGTASAGASTAAPAQASFVPAPAPTRTVVVAAPSGSTGAGAGRATDVVSRFYSTYLARPGRQTAANFVEPSLLEKLYLPRTTEDGVICGDALPDTATVSTGTVSGSTATVRVTTTHQSSIQRLILVTVRLSDLRITKITCES